MSSKELNYSLHDADLLWIEGVTNAYCDWRYVKQNAFHIIKRTIELAKPPYKAYRVLAERETGYGTLAKENKEFHFEIIEKQEISLMDLTNERD